MKYQEIIELVRSSPSDQDVATAFDWLARRKKCTKSVQSVLETLVAVRQDKQTLESVGQWIRDKDWNTLCWAAAKFETPEVHDWLVEFAIENSSNVEVYKLWCSLLREYKDKDVTRGATSWLLDHPAGREAADVVECMLGRRTAVEVKAIARKLAIDFPEATFVARVIEYAGSEDVNELGRKLLKSCDPIRGSMIAAALLKDDPDREWPIVEKWLKTLRMPKDSSFLLYELLGAAPLKMAGFVFEWLDKHPLAAYDIILLPPLVLSPSQEYLDLLWSWGKRRIRGKQAATILKLVLNSPESLNIPEGALRLAESWVRSHLDSSESLTIMVRLMRIQPTEEKFKLAEEWLTKNFGADQGRMFLALSRSPKKLEYKEQAMAWITNHPREIDSQLILLEYLEQEPDPTMIEFAKRLLDSRYVDTDRILVMLIKQKDEDGVRLAKERLTQRTLEFRYRISAKHAGAPIIVALLEAFPQDKEVIAIAEDWLQNEDICEYENDTCEHIAQVQAAYERLSTTG